MTAPDFTRSPLPIDDLLPEIARHLEECPNLVIEAAPGAGKTTRIPPLLLSLVAGKVLVLEPRRIAARLAAHRAAAELREPVGRSVGYSVRFEAVGSVQTRLLFVTEGVLNRRFISDPELSGIDAVVLDEFHERHLDTDLALALLKRLQGRRPELKIIVMSATLDSAPIAAFLNGCPVMKSSGRQFPLEIRYQSYSALPLERQVEQAVGSLLSAANAGNVLVFLPGAAEIRHCMRACEAVARAAGATILPLHGDLSPEEQDRALSPNALRKVIFSTNIAESSVTIDGVVAVIDSGLARSAGFSPWSGLPTLQVARISKAAAHQRAGRAGRVGPGVAYRLYAQEDFHQRPDQELPAILRSDLSGVSLTLRAIGISSMTALEWLQSPPVAAVQHADDILDQLGVTDENCTELARLPVPPRLARMLVEARKLGIADQGIEAAALLASGLRSDELDLLDLIGKSRNASFDRYKRQLRTFLKPVRDTMADEDSLLRAVLSGFPDRVAQLKAKAQVLLSNGVSVALAGASPSYEFMVVLDAEIRSDRQGPTARLVARVEPEWLFDLFPDQVQEKATLVWSDTSERVEGLSALCFGALTLQQSRDNDPDPESVASLLFAKAWEVGLEHFVGRDALEQTLARTQFAGLPTPNLQTAFRSLCEGAQSFADLHAMASSFLPWMEAQAGPQLDRLAPSTFRLPGRFVKVHYKSGQPPWITSRLQDFFGLSETPRLGPAKTQIVIHLLAPNQRAVQVTADLAGFWDRLYPDIRRELMRRYPRHAWPENPRLKLTK